MRSLALTRLLRRRLSHCCAALLLGTLACPIAQAKASTDYDSLIRRARAGDTAPALAYLRQLGASASLTARFDHIVIASWAGATDEVLEVYQRLPDERLPPTSVALAVARALRDRQRWPEALMHWRAGLQREPAVQTDFAAGLTMTLADAGQTQEAVQTGRDWVAREPDHIELRLALAYAYQANQQPFDALHHADQALQRAKHHPPKQHLWVHRAYIDTLRRTGLAQQALRYAEQHPQAIDAAQLRVLHADVAAQQTRLAAVPSHNEAERFVIADRALARYDALIRQWQALGPQADADLQRIRIDRLIALHARVRMAEVVQGYEELVAENITVPTWALADVAAAYLYQRQPERALELYQQALTEMAADPQTWPEDSLELLAARIGLSYAYSESERFESMDALLAQIQASQAPTRKLVGQPLSQPNPYYLDAQLAVVTARLAADDTPAAQAQMAEMVARAPNNTNLRAQLAGIERARALPRRAETQLKLAETLAPRSLTLEIGQGFVALDLAQWRQAEELSRDTLARFPEDLQARRLARLWQVHNKRELRVSGQRGLASDSPVAGKGDTRLEAVLYSAPLAYHWRGFAGLGYAEGKYEEGSIHATWQRAGLEWRSRDWWAEGEVSAQQYGHGGKPGLRLALTYDADDHWQFGGELRRRSNNTPLRALRTNIHADALETYVRGRAHERREWRLGLTGERFSDGNRRWGASLNGRERLLTGPHWQLDALLELAHQRNSKNAQRPYFNPKSDLLVLPALRVNHILHRHYETVWEHFVTASAGLYQQRGFGSGGVLGLAYGQRWRYDDVLELAASLEALSRPYDGRREREVQARLELRLLF